MPQAIVNDLWLHTTSAAVTKTCAQKIDTTGAREASLVVTLKSVQFSAAATATVKATVLASDEEGNWFPLSTTPPNLTWTITATAAGQKAGESKPAALTDLKGWRWLRVEYELSRTSGSGTLDGFLSSILNLNLGG